MYDTAKANMSAGQALRQSRPLDRIAQSADRVEVMGARLHEIIDRFHGSSPKTSGGETPPMSFSYLTSLDRLQEAIERADKAIETLNEVA